MFIKLKVNTSSSKTSITLIDGVYLVKFKAVREKGKANEKLVEILADYFKVSKSRIKIIRGQNSTNKLIEIQKS